MKSEIQRIFDLDHEPVYRLYEDGGLIVIEFGQSDCPKIQFNMLSELGDLFRSQNIEVLSTQDSCTWQINIRED